MFRGESTKKEGRKKKYFSSFAPAWVRMNLDVTNINYEPLKIRTINPYFQSFLSYSLIAPWNKPTGVLLHPPLIRGGSSKYPKY
jgi:hypothetical protein